MKSALPQWQTWVLALAAAGVLGGCVVAPADSYSYYDDGYVAPPPPRAEHRGYPPAVDYIWIDGYWDRAGRGYDWVPGYWVPPSERWRLQQRIERERAWERERERAIARQHERDREDDRRRDRERQAREREREQQAWRERDRQREAAADRERAERERQRDRDARQREQDRRERERERERDRDKQELREEAHRQLRGDRVHRDLDDRMRQMQQP